jgi:hypothetical protein
MVGRPTKYLPEYGEIAIELMRQGASIIEVAYKLNVARSTIYEWIENYEEFSDTIKLGRDFSEGWWMEQGRLNLWNKEFSPTLFYMNMKNRHGWSDKQETHASVTLKQEDVLKELE